VIQGSNLNWIALVSSVEIAIISLIFPFQFFYPHDYLVEFFKIDREIFFLFLTSQNKQAAFAQNLHLLVNGRLTDIKMVSNISNGHALLSNKFNN